MTNDEIEMLSIVARGVAWRYKKIASWVDVAELEQACWLAFMEAARTFDPAVGVPFYGYAKTAAVRECWALMWRSRSPVTACRSNLPKMKDMVVEHDACDELLSRASTPDEIVNEIRWHAATSRALNDLFDAPEYVIEVERIDGVRCRCNVARQVLLEQESPAKLAARIGVPVTQVYRACARARRRIVGSFSLWELVQERVGKRV